jgi:hypothetical protein
VTVCSSGRQHEGSEGGFGRFVNVLNVVWPLPAPAMAGAAPRRRAARCLRRRRRAAAARAAGITHIAPRSLVQYPSG